MNVCDEDLLWADPWEEEDHDGMERCELCGDWYKPSLMSLDIDGYCKFCVSDVIGQANALAMKYMSEADYELYRKIYEPVEDVA